MHITPPSAADVEAAARAAPIMATLAKLRDHLGPEGRRLSATGGLSFDRHELAGILGLALIPDPDDPDAPDVVTGDLKTRFDLAITVAIECGAVDDRGDRLIPNASWFAEDVIVQAETAVSTMIELGPTWTSLPRGEPFFDLRDANLDRMAMYWLTTLLPSGREQRVDHFVNWAIDECREQIGCDPFPRVGEFDLFVTNATCYLIDALAWAGAIDWWDQRLCRSELEPDTRWFGGGMVRLTALARHVLPDHLADVGIKLREPDPDGVPTPAGLIDDVMVEPDEDVRRALVARWRRDLDDGERARLVAEALLDAGHAPMRMAGFTVLELIGPEAAAPYVRQLLDSPSAETAALFLLTNGLASEDEIQPFLGLGPLVDAFAAVANQPERFVSGFVDLLEKVEAPELLLEVFALHATPEATMVLTAAARHVTDPRFADLCRAAELYHRDWLAERDPAL